MFTPGLSPEHTPVPWCVEQAPDGYASEMDAYTRIYYSNGATVAVTYVEEDEESLPLNVCESNAEFIVRAVNAHDDLLAACEALVEELDGPWRCVACRAKEGHFNECPLPRAKGAIAKARPSPD